MRPIRALKNASAGVIALWSALAVTWLLLSGHYTPLPLALGLASSVVVAWLAARMGLTADKGPTRRLARSAPYALHLLTGIVRANLDVIRRVLDPRLPVHPTIVELEATQRTDAWRVVYANSITLTPGTISVELSGRRLRVHALTRDAAAALSTGDLDRRVAAIDRG
ncbi:MAG: Na+/H+ antiporter subunit E [Candidatus Limnocylindria bacterium]